VISPALQLYRADARIHKPCGAVAFPFKGIDLDPWLQGAIKAHNPIPLREGLAYMWASPGYLSAGCRLRRTGAMAYKLLIKYPTFSAVKFKRVVLANPKELNHNCFCSSVLKCVRNTEQGSDRTNSFWVMSYGPKTAFRRI